MDVFFASGAVSGRSPKLKIETRDRFDLSARLCIKLKGICDLASVVFTSLLHQFFGNNKNF